MSDAAPTYCQRCRAVHWYCEVCQQALCAHVFETIWAEEDRLFRALELASL